MNVLPKEEKFFALFEEQARFIAESAKLLTAAVRGGNAQLGSYMAQVRDLEHKCDVVTHDIITRLNHTFITPFDPEDIHRLASCLDDVLDMIDATVGRLVLFKVAVLPPAVAELAEIIEASSRALLKAVTSMSHDETVMESLI